MEGKYTTNFNIAVIWRDIRVFLGGTCFGYSVVILQCVSFVLLCY